MRKLAEIEERIRALSDVELAEFRRWYEEFDAHAWDERFEAGVRARKLDVLDEAARRALEGEGTKP